MKKRVLAVMLTLAMLLSLMPMTVFAADTNTWDGTVDKTWYEGNESDTSFTIITGAQLAGLAQLVNGGNNFSGKTITLGADIDLNNQEWTPIGKSDKKFQGIFDGDNKTISNLKISNRNLDYAGLFGYASSPMKLQNLNIVNADILASEDVGILVGNAFTGTISNIVISGVIKLTACCYAGGIAGEGYAKIENCSIIANEGSGSFIKSDDRTNGYHWTLIGGIRGFTGEGNVKTSNCTVKNVEISGAHAIGGITGNIHYGNTVENCLVENCRLTISSQGSFSGYTVGAIGGRTVNHATNKITITNCRSVNNTVVNGFGEENNYLIASRAYLSNSAAVPNNIGVIVNGSNYQFDKFNDALDAALEINDSSVDNAIYFYADYSSVELSAAQATQLAEKKIPLVSTYSDNKIPVLSEEAANTYKIITLDSLHYVKLKDTEPDYAAKRGDIYYSTGNAGKAISEAALGETVYLKESTDQTKTITVEQSLTIVSEVEGAVWTGAVPAENCKIITETDGNSTTYRAVVDDIKAEAKVGETYYPTLDAAVKATASGTIEVLKNVDLGSSYITIGADKDITLELNGYTVGSTARYVFYLSSTGKLTIQDSSTGKTGTIQGNKNYGIYTASKTVTVTVRSGNIIGETTGLYGCYGGTITIEDGKITGGTYGLDMYDAGTCTLKGGTIEGGTHSVYVRYSTANVNISGGMYNGEIYKKFGTVTISGGYFTSDPTAYLAAGKAIVTSDQADYAYKVGDPAKIEVGDGETPVKVEVHPAPDTSPKADTANMTTSTENAEEAAAQKAAVKTAIESATSNGLNAEAAAVAEDSNKVTKTHVANGLEEVKKPTEQGGLGLADTTTASDIKLVVQPYLDIEAKSYTATATEKTLNVEISPKYNLLATTSGTDVTALNTTGEGGSKNAVIVESNKDLPTDENTQVTINFQLPSGFITDAQMDKVFVVHTKQDRSTETYKATVTKSGGIYTATFTTNGFSPFVFTVDTRSAQVQFKDKDGNSIGSAVTYLPTNVGDALPTTAAPDGQIFGGWQFADINGTYTTLTDALLTALDTKTDPITATPYFYTPSYGGSGSSTTTYPVSASSNVKNGTVTVSPKNAAKGATVTITVKPDKGYELDSLTVTDKNGDQVKLTDKGNGEYTFTMPASKVDVKTSFVEAKTSGTNPFVDVSESAYYYDAVLWAVENGITGGTTDTTFSPNASCTRAQAVTFLWRAAGSPAPKSSAMPFGDVAADAYYHDAVLWAMEQGITQGTTATAFSPNAVCTRGQIVTFLWRAEASEAAGAVSAFTDVASNAYYAGAVDWAVENGITQGTTATTFSPAMNCTRAQIVTFLYRDYQGK